MNILRTVAVILFAVLFGQIVTIIFHDYVGTIVVLLWLYVFWKIANGYLLVSLPEEDDPSEATSPIAGSATNSPKKEGSGQSSGKSRG